MISVKPYECAHLMAMNVQDWQRQPEFEINDAYCEFLLENSVDARTIMAGDKVLSCGGVIELWPGRGEVWTMLDRDCGRWMKSIHSITTAFLDEHNNRYPRLETGCEIEWPQAHRWLKMLGFEHERTARKYMPSGRDLDIYVRIR